MTIAITSSGSLPASPTVPGHYRTRECRITFDSSYPTGGYAITAATFGLTSLDTVKVGGTTLVGRLATWDATNKKVMVFKAVATEADNATDLSADSVHVTAVGR